MVDEKEGNNKPVVPLFMTFGNQDLPAFVEVKGKDWIYYGENNDYSYYLIDLYSQSAIHKAIIDGKVSYISGNGWGVDTMGMNTEQKAKALKMLEQPFGISNLTDATYRWSQNLELFNCFHIKVTWSNDKNSATLSYIDSANLRTNADESLFFYTSKWFEIKRDGSRKAVQRPEQNKDWKVYKPYNPNDRTGEQIYYWKAPHPDQAVYSLPVYAGAVTWINIDVSLSKYFYNTVETAFVPTHLINFFGGETTQEKADRIEQRIKEKWTSPTGNRIIVNHAPNKELAANVETLSMSDADKQYEAVRKYSEQAIITGHRVTSGMLFGQYREGSLGGRSELMFAEEHFQNSYITPRQNIIEGVINEIARDLGITSKFYLNKVKRVGFTLDDATITASLTPEEKRKLALQQVGLNPDTINANTPAADLLKNIGSISPLVANKVLETLTPSEIRGMVGLTGNGQPKPAAFAALSEKAEAGESLKRFMSAGHDGSHYELLFERELEAFDKDSVDKSEMEFSAMLFAADIKANALERQIIDLLKKDGTMQADAIAKVTKSTANDVTAAIARLADRGILEAATTAANGDAMKGYTVTPKGDQALEQQPAKTASVKVVYRYGLAPKFKDQPEILPDGRTRDFCAGMIELSRGGMRWTSEQIFSLDPGDGINPWTQRGGWYTKPGSDVRIPVCRHVWIQQLVKEVQ